MFTSKTILRKSPTMVTPNYFISKEIGLPISLENIPPQADYGFPSIPIRPD